MTRMKSYGKRLLAGLLLTLACTGIVYGCEGRIRVLRVGVFSGSYWDAPIGNSCAVIDAAIERFEAEHPGVQVEYTSGILKRDYSEWLIGRFLVGREPDIFMILPEDFGMLYGLGALEPLDQWIERDGEVSQKDFYFAALEGGRTKDIQYALPYECVPTLMFVNKSLLREEGIAVPESDWSWEQFYDICAAVTRDLDGDGKPDRFGSYGYTWRDALASNGIAVFSEDGAHSLLAYPQAAEAAAFAQRLSALYQGCEISARDFDQGRVAFRPFLFSDYRTYQPYPWRIKRYSSFEWDCIPMPSGPSGSNSSELSTVMAGISSRTGKTGLAWEFLKELTCSEETQSMLFTDSHGASALRRVTQSKQTRLVLRQDTPGESRLALEALPGTMEQAIAAPRFRNDRQANLLADSLVEAAIADEQNLDLQLARAHRELEEFLNR